MRGRSFKLTQPAFIAFVMIMLLLSTFTFFLPQTTSDDFPEEDIPDPPINTRPYLLEPPFNPIYIDEEFEWEGRVAVEDNDTVEWNITHNMTGDDYTEYEWYPDNYSVKLKIKCAQTFQRWFNVSVTDFTFPAAYWNWTVYCNYTGGTNYYWTGGGDGYQWDDFNNWVIYSAGSYSAATAGQYPNSNDDEAHINETADTIYLKDGVNSVVTIGNLTLESGFTGTLNLSVDLIVDNANTKDGNITVNAGTLDTNGTANNQINLDGNLTVSATIDEQEGTIIVQGAQVQRISITNSQKLYKLTTDTASTVGELYDNLTVYQITIGTGTIYKADANTRGYELWTNFTDATLCGFVQTSSGTLNLDGVFGGPGANITTADPSPPPSYTWYGTPSGTTQMRLLLDNATLSYGYLMTLRDTATSISSLVNVTFSNFVSTYALWVRDTQATTTITDVTITSTSSTDAFRVLASTSLTITDLVISSFTGTNDIQISWTGSPKVVEFIDSNFDTTKIKLDGSAHANAWISTTHNDIANAYKLGCQDGHTLSKSTITNDYDTLSNVQLISGTFTIDETSASDDFTVDSGATLVLNTGITHTFDADANLTNNGVLKSDGTITTGGYFNFYNPGSVWLNNSTVSNADLNYYYSGFNFSIGKAANSTIDDFAFEAPSGQDFAINFTSIDFSVKSTGVVYHYNATVTSGTAKTTVGNLTVSTGYDLYVDDVLNQELLQTDASGNIYYEYNDWSTKWFYLIYIGEKTQPGQWDRWIVGFEYEKNIFTNEVRFTATFNYSHNASWYIWEFGDGSVYESASPNITRNFAFSFYSVEDVKLTIIATDGNRYWAESPVILDNSLWIALLCLAVITLSAIAILKTRKARRKTELVMVEEEGIRG